MPSAAAPEQPIRTGSSPAGIAASVAAVTGWGVGNSIIASIDLPSLAIAFWRLAFATALYVPALYLRGGRLRRESFRFGWLGGTAYGTDVALFFIAVHLTSVANATTINALQPLVVMGFAAVMFGERVRPRQVGAAVAATVGVALVAFGAARSGSGDLRGDLVAVAALFAWAWYFLASKRARSHLPTLEYLTVMNGIALVVVAPIALLSGSLGSVAADLGDGRWLWILAVVAVPGSGHLLINWAHGHTMLVTISLLTLAMPVISTVTAAVFLDQRVVAVQGIGIAVVLASLAFVILGESMPAGAVPASSTSTSASASTDAT